MTLFSFSPNTKAESAKVNANFNGLSTGEEDVDANSLELTRSHILRDFIFSGLTIPTSVTLVSSIAAGIAYVNGKYVATTLTNKTFTASKDTYVDLQDDGTLVYNEVANGAASPALTAGNIRVAKVVTSGTAVTSVTQTGVDTLGNQIYQIDPSVQMNWIPFTPTLTNFAATINSASYCKIGKTVFVQNELTLTGAPSGTLQVSRPTTAKARSYTYNYEGLAGMFDDSAAILYTGKVRYNNSTSVLITADNIATPNFTRNSNGNATTPFTWASPDVATLNYSYEEA